MFGGILSKISTLAKKASLVDVIPNSLDPGYYGDTVTSSEESNNAYFQITGISTSITLKLTWTSPNTNVYYQVSPTLAEFPTQYAETLTPILNGGTLSVSNGEFVIIGASSGDAPISTSINVLNNSNSDTQLTTVLIDIA